MEYLNPKEKSNSLTRCRRLGYPMSRHEFTKTHFFYYSAVAILLHSFLNPFFLFVFSKKIDHKLSGQKTTETKRNARKKNNTHTRFIHCTMPTCLIFFPTTCKYCPAYVNRNGICSQSVQLPICLCSFSSFF